MVSVVTILISLCPPTAAKLQRNTGLSPMQWLHEVNAGDIQCKIGTFFTLLNVITKFNKFPTYHKICWYET